jgi:hypothetical protein
MKSIKLSISIKIFIMTWIKVKLMLLIKVFLESNRWFSRMAKFWWLLYPKLFYRCCTRRTSFPKVWCVLWSRNFHHREYSSMKIYVSFCFR